MGRPSNRAEREERKRTEEARRKAEQEHEAGRQKAAEEEGKGERFGYVKCLSHDVQKCEGRATAYHRERVGLSS